MTDPPAELGPYHIRDTIGSGGMGVVYEAVHPETGARVAIKTVRVARQRLLSSFRREVRALGRIRHPGVVRILDDGVHDGLPWYAMEYLDGAPLDRFAETVTARADLLGLVRRLCDALAYVHGEGIVHRDLKPANIVVRADGTPVLVDFGIVSQFSGASGREVLDTTGDLVGTVPYMAPEQILGEIVDARADLYALGCIVYQLLTGRMPFPGENSNAVMLAKLHKTPPPPSQIVPGIEPELDALVLRLLAREPGARIGHADTVAAALARLAGDADRPVDLPRPRAYLYHPGFAGRTAEIEALTNHVSRLATDAGGFVMVGGESGAGKTRLLAELTRSAALGRVTLLIGECAPAGTSANAGSAVAAPLQGLLGPLRAIADRCREHGPLESRRLVGARAPVFARYEPSCAGLPGLVDTEPAELPAPAARLRLFNYLAETLGALAATRPVLLLVDDLQWADDLTLGLLELLANGDFFTRHRLLVVTGYRSEEAATRLERLARAPGVHHIQLGRLGDEAVAAIISDMLALAPAPEPLSRFLARHAAGNPFFIAEYLRAAVDEQLLVRDDAGEWHAVEADPDAPASAYDMLGLPRSLGQLVARRLEGLPADARAVATAAAVLGREVREDLLAAVAGIGGERLVDASGELVRRNVLEDDNGRLRFVHDALREGAYAAIPDGERVRLHRTAATAIEALPEEDVARSHAALAHHWERGGERDLAAAHYLAAAGAAKDRFALRESEKLYGGYLRLVDEPTAESVRARNDLARAVLRLRGRIPEAIREQERALEEARRVGDVSLEALGLLGLATIYRETGRLEDARDLFDETLAKCRATGNRVLEADALGGLANTLMKLGRLEEARALYLTCLELGRALGNRAVETTALADIAVVRDTMGDAEGARELYERSLALAPEVGNRRLVGILNGNLALLAATRGHSQEARRLYEEALAIHRETGDVQSEGTALGNLAYLCEEIGAVAEARSLYEQALAIHRRIGNRMYEGIVLEDWATLERRSGRLARALELAGEAERVLRDCGAPFYLAVCLCEIGHVRLASGEPADACLGEAKELAAGLAAGGESHLAKVIARLERAVAADAAGGLLFRGECPADLPAGLHGWLVRTGQLAGT